METADAAARVKALIDLTEELTAIVTRENELLATRRPAELAPLQADKARLAAAYAQSIRAVAADRLQMAGAGPDLIEQLKELTRTFETRAQRQRALLDGARVAGESVVRAIASETASRSDQYGAARTDRSAPLVLNEKA